MDIYDCRDCRHVIPVYKAHLKRYIPHCSCGTHPIPIIDVSNCPTGFVTKGCEKMFSPACTKCKHVTVKKSYNVNDYWCERHGKKLISVDDVIKKNEDNAKLERLKIELDKQRELEEAEKLKRYEAMRKEKERLWEEEQRKKAQRYKELEKDLIDSVAEDYAKRYGKEILGIDWGKALIEVENKNKDIPKPEDMKPMTPTERDIFL